MMTMLYRVPYWQRILTFQGLLWSRKFVYEYLAVLMAGEIYG